jgi:hypothetical protein
MALLLARLLLLVLARPLPNHQRVLLEIPRLLVLADLPLLLMVRLPPHPRWLERPRLPLGLLVLLRLPGRLLL